VAALKAAEGRPVETLKVYAHNLRTGFAGGDTPRDVSALTAIDRVLAGIAKPGERLDDMRLRIKGITPEGEGIVDFRPGGAENWKPLTPEEYRALEEGNKTFEAKLQDLKEGGLPTDEGTYIDVRSTPCNKAYARSDGKPTFAGRVAGAMAAGGWTALLGAGLNPIVGLGMGALMMIPGFGMGLRALLSLTPSAQATGVVNGIVDHLAVIMRPLGYVKDSDAAVEAARLRIRSLANTPHMAARELSVASIGRPEGAVLPFALKGTADVVDAMVSNWYGTKQIRSIFDSAGEILGYKSADLIAKALTDQGAKALFEEYVQAIKGADDASVADLSKIGAVLYAKLGAADNAFTIM